MSTLFRRFRPLHATRPSEAYPHADDIGGGKKHLQPPMGPSVVTLEVVCETTSRSSRNPSDGRRRVFEPEAARRPQSRHPTQRVEQPESLLSSRREPHLVPVGDRERHSIAALAKS